MSPRTLAECRLLMIDDEAPNLELLDEFLSGEGFGGLVRTTDPREAAPLFEAHAPDLVLLDLHMPHLNGFEVMQQIRARTGAGDFVPILVLTADASRATRARALADGAHDFLTKPLDAIEVRLRVRNLLNTRLLHLEQTRAREAAEAATAARDRVLSVVAHDLRNPLAAIAMDAEMVRCLLDEEAHADQFEGVARIERIAHRMHGMIEDLLDVSRLERGTFAVRPVPCEPRDVLAEAEAMMRPLAGAKGVALAFEGPDELPAVPADSGRLMQALSNLVGNALDFTPSGGSIRVTWEMGDADLTVRISDTGAGIPPEQLPLVFGEFWQGTSARRRSGIGLGLVITRAIVEGHGGRIGIESSVGAGTTVTFTLPRTAAALAPRAAQPAEGARR